MADPITLALIAGTVMSAGSAIVGGNNEDKAALADAKQLEKAGIAEFAKGTRDQAESERQRKVMESNIRAQMGVTDDAQGVRTIAESNSAFEYNGLAAMYGAKSAKQGLDFKAKSRLVEGKNAKAAGRVKALKTVISAVGTAYAGGMMGGGGAGGSVGGVGSGQGYANQASSAGVS